ncbi:hypothetical protein PFICI_02684 [Pestalotiopsis fici W106-1]|uniref:Heterokaryon incompatibility domain-containing protein n=1 Tax=Pestalotiopsis fici (strain W106-1 / CGMCC3.15140) TaxID=1229662 RepID=W3XF63_PESFW|nr:uncharacterized protein PFICI_02684 [Pestalotiopsis fici W106-1]ETS84659.1 hypothetical protein PFICI_02684 [Pestalotiopsis fici W106-1]
MRTLLDAGCESNSELSREPENSTGSHINYQLDYELAEQSPYRFSGDLSFSVASNQLTTGCDIPELSNTAESDASFKYITNRLHNCKTHHDSCRFTKEWYPSRLIAIQQKDEKIRLRVIQTAEEAVTGPYVTLSHCWGQVQPLRLTNQNFEEFGRNIPMAMVPSLHKDAVTVATRLGVSYLWIDCLCIIQDSDEDWRRESSVMGSVYEYALFNIAAASATDSSGRLFTIRDSQSVSPDVIALRMRRAQDQVLWHMDRELDPWSFRRSQEFWRYPLFKRAWVLQETLFANRAVIFTQDEIHFRCAQEFSSERMPPEHPLLQNTQFSNSTNRELVSVPLMKFTLPDHCFEDWRKIREHYSSTAIARASDRLIAISAIARHFGSMKKQSKYHAGMWDDQFIVDLGWHTLTPQRRPDVYIAPTWSWASICGRDSSRINYPRLTSRQGQIQIPKVLEIYTKPSGHDEFGAIDNGWLKICTPLYYMGCRKGKEELKSALEQRYGAVGVQRSFLNLYPDHQWEHDRAPLNVFALPLQIEVSSQPVLEAHLLLLVALTPAENVYKRIGLCYFCILFTDEFWGLPKSKEPERFLGRMERRDEEIHSHKKCDDGWHTITIV